MKSILVFMLGLIPISSLADTQRVVMDVNPLVIEALSTDKPIKAQLKGGITEKIRIESKAPANKDVFVTVKGVQNIRPGCKRVQVTFSMPDHMMKLKTGGEEPLSFWYQLNICTDGNPPHLSAIGKE